jgi:hypothetical protein
MTQDEMEQRLNQLSETMATVSDILAVVLEATDGGIANYGIDVPATLQTLSEVASSLRPAVPMNPQPEVKP